MEFNDNPYDRHKGLNIMVNDDLTIDMQSKGTKIKFESRVPTKDELRSCERVIMTSPTEWNPERVVMKEINTKDKLHSPYLFNETKNEYEYDNIHMDDNNKEIAHFFFQCIPPLFPFARDISR